MFDVSHTDGIYRVSPACRMQAEGEQFKQMLINVLRLLSNRVALGDGTIEYVLKDVA